MNTYKTKEPVPKGYSEERIVKHIKKYGDTPATELYKLSNNKVKALNELVAKGVIYKTKNNKYRLFRTEYEEIRGDFINLMAVGCLKVRIAEMIKQGKMEFNDETCALLGIDHELLDTFGELVPDFMDDIFASMR